VNLSEGIDGLFAAALDRAEWPETLDRLAASADADGATLVVGPSTPETVAVSRSITDVVSDYFERRAVDDPREDRIIPTLERGFVSDFDLFTPAEIARDPFYQEFLRPHGFAWNAAACLALAPEPIFLSFKRRRGMEPFRADEIAALDAALPYLRALAASFAAAQDVVVTAELDAFARIGLGAIALDGRGRALHANRLVTLGDGITLMGGVPRATLAEDQAALDAVLRLALRAEPATAAPPPRRILLRRKTGKRGLAVEAIPLRGGRDNPLSRARALLLLTDLDRAAPPTDGDLRTIFGLTPREAALAVRLARGERLEAAATALRISREHARQRLKVIFDKTSTHRQAELVALLARLRGPAE
jgi:DNA-binding CsgD family transcriptional regulator